MESKTRNIIVGTVIIIVVMCIAVAILGPSAPEYKVETSVADHGGATCIQATVRGESGGLTLYLSDPSKNTVDQTYISDGEMADGVETKYLALMGPIGGVGTTATPGTYNLTIVNLHGDTVHKEEFTFGGANVSIIGCDPIYEYLEYVGYYLDRLTITGRNDGDLTAYIGGVYVSINGQEGSSLIGAGDVTDLGGGDFTVEAKNFFLGPFSEGTYTMTLTMRTEPLGGGEVLATYTTTIDVTSSTTPTPTPEIVLAGYTSSPVSSAGLDIIYLDDVGVTLKNEDNAPAEIYKLILTVGDEEYTSIPWETLDPQEEADFAICCWGSVSREIGVYSFTGKLEVQDSNYQTLLEQDLAFTIPTFGMDDTLPEVGGTDNISFTPLWWAESSIAVYDWGDEMTGHDYWTFTAKSGMKFIILAFELKNNSIRSRTTPWIGGTHLFSYSEIVTDQGYIYPVWDNPSPYYSESDEYNPRKSTEGEINNLIGDSAAFKKLLPGESVVGCVVFEISEEATPVEVDLDYIAPLIIF